MAVVTIFGSRAADAESLAYQDALLAGKLLGEAGFDIATGGYGGIMEAAFIGAKDYNVRKIGITTAFYTDRFPNKYMTEGIVAKTYIDRLNELLNVGDAYIVFPGDSGTLLEMSAVWALKEKSVIGDKPLICIGDQWSEVVQTMGFYSERLIDNMDKISHVDCARDAVEMILEKFGKV